jgi:hypothetical protein
MTIEQLKEQLHKGPVKFSYRKKDGSVRTALGTLNGGFIPEEHVPKDAGYAAPDNVQRYYDLNSQGWRSFLIENLLNEVAEEDAEG